MARGTHATMAVLCWTVTLTLSAAGQKPVRIEMRNVRLHSDERIILDVRRLRGTMNSRAAGAPPIFDAPRSYVIDVAAAEIAIDVTRLQNLMNDYVLAGDGAPLKDVELAVRDRGLEMKGKLRKGVDHQTLVVVEQYGVKRMLAELQAGLHAGTYRP